MLNLEIPERKLGDFQKFNLKSLSPQKKVYFDHENKVKYLEINTELAILKAKAKALIYIYNHISKLKNTAAKLIGIDHFTQAKNHQMLYLSSTCPALAKQSANIYLEGNFDNYFRPFADTEADAKRSRESHFGGMTFYNKNVLLCESDDEKIESYDINSIYPYIMSEMLPIGHPEDEPNYKWENCIEFVEINPDPGLTWIPELSFISRKPLADKFFKNDGISRFICREFADLLAQVTNRKFKLGKQMYFKAEKPLAGWIWDNYWKKVGAEDPNTREICKLKLNSIYGKMGERNICRSIKVNEEFRTSFIPRGQGVERLCYSSCYVVNKGWILMITSILKEVQNGNTVLYGDTDSLKILRKTPKLALEVNNTKLGAWKFEGRYIYYSNLGISKKYLLIKKDGTKEMRLSGIPVEWNEILQNLPENEVKKIFDPQFNFVFKNAKTSRKEKGYNDVSIQINSKIKPTHEIEITGKIKKL